jgi:GTP-binding protein
MLNLATARFFTSASKWTDLPPSHQPEVCFAGRSNAGKSTTINMLANRKRLAFASKTPGRTRLINYFAISGDEPESIAGFLVDLPGYGHAEVPQTEKAHWQRFLAEYVARRAQIAGLILIMDARRPFTDLDLQLVRLFAISRRPIHAVLTKADKLNRSEQAETLRRTRTVASTIGDEFGVSISVQLFSSLKREGLEAASAVVIDWLEGKGAATADLAKASDLDS